MEDILKDLGWDDGFRIPVANAENKALEMEVQKKQKEKENLSSVLEDISEKVSGMKNHLLNVQHQMDQNQNLIFAHGNQKVAEENLVKLTRIEDKALTNEIKNIKKEQRDVQDRQNNVQMDINKILERIQKLNGTIKWDKDALLEWDEDLSKGEDDTVVLEKFMKQDEVKFRELELKRQCLALDVENRRNKLYNIKNDVLSMEQSLDKTAQMFRRQHLDRRTLVQQWESSVRVLNQRDEDIRRIVEEMGNLRTLARQKLKDLEEQKSFFENEELNNKELEREIEVLNRQTWDTKEKIKILETIITDETDKYLTMKTILSNTSNLHNNEMRKYREMMKEIDRHKAVIDSLKAKLEKAKLECRNSKCNSTSAVERVQQLSDLLKEEEKVEEKNLAEFKKLDDLLYQVTQQIMELKMGEKNQMSNIEHISCCTTTLKKDIAKANSVLNRQKEILYNMDFAYMEKDFLLNKILGVVKERDAERHEQRILELEQINTNLMATNSLLTKEVTHLEEDMRRLTLDIQWDGKEQNYLKSRRQDSNLTVECGQKQLKVLRSQNQDKQVEENVLKLRVKQAEKAIDKVGGNVFSLEKQRLELEHAMKEREVEIKTLRDILNVRKRVLLEQSSNLNSRISLARLKVEHLKNKYEVELNKLEKDENGEPLSIAHLKIRAAREKLELQENKEFGVLFKKKSELLTELKFFNRFFTEALSSRKNDSKEYKKKMGDRLDSKIKKTEKEIEAMENTLKVVNATNKVYKNNLRKIDEDSKEFEEKEELEGVCGELLLELRARKSFFDELCKITANLENEYEEKLKTEENILRLWKEKDAQAAEIDKDLKEQEEKLERAEKQLRKLIKEIRGTQAPKFQTLEEKDIELRELMEQNEYGLQQLAELVAKTYDTEPVVVKYLSEKNLSLPVLRSPSSLIKYASTTSLQSPGRSSVSSRSSTSLTSRTSTCMITPSVVTLDSTKLSESTKSGSFSKSSTKSGSKSDSKSGSKSSLKAASTEKLSKGKQT